MSTNSQSSQLPALELSRLRASLLKEGLELIGFSRQPPEPKYYSRLQEWRSRGMAGEMKFMETDLDTFRDPFQLHPKSSGIISFIVPYSTTPRIGGGPGTGLIARYAWGRDYHNLVRRAAQRIRRSLQSLVGGPIVLWAHSDSAPILERPMALQAGGGFLGKNSMLIRPGRGSFFLIGEIYFENPIVCDEESFPARASSCKSCNRCTVGCPTGAIVAPGMVDSRRCISYLTIEHRGIFSRDQREMLGSWLFGCDICQELCPFNYAALKVGTVSAALPPREELKHGYLTLGSILSISNDADFATQFRGTPLMRPGREGLIRNACAVATNLGYKVIRPQLEQLINQDCNSVVVQSCAEALEHL